MKRDKADYPSVIRGLNVRVCVLPRVAQRGLDVGRQCSIDEAWTWDPGQIAMYCVAKGERATVSVSQGGRQTYWDVCGTKSAKEITHKLNRSP